MTSQDLDEELASSLAEGDQVFRDWLVDLNNLSSDKAVLEGFKKDSNAFLGAKLAYEHGVTPLELVVNAGMAALG